MRCYIRGTSLLGLFNSVVGCIFNRVLVKVTDIRTGKVERYFWGKGTDFSSLKDVVAEVKLDE